MNYRIDAEGGQPAYIQLYRQLVADITAGVYTAGQKLPSKRTVAEECGVPFVEYNENGLGDMLDYGSDFADLHHLNVKGSMKFSLRLGQDLLAACDLPDHREDPAYASYDEIANAWYDHLSDWVSKPREGEIGF